MALSIKLEQDSAAAMAAKPQKPRMGMVEVQDIARKVDIYAVHPDVLEVLGKSADMDHVKRVREQNKERAPGKEQTDILIIKFRPEMPRNEFIKVTDQLYKARGKNNLADEHVLDRLRDKGYMVVSEEGAVEAIMRMAPKQVHGAGVGAKSVA